MSQRELTVENRTETGKETNGRMRRAGRIPAVLYGHGELPRSFSVNTREFSDLVLHHGTHSLLVLRGDGGGETALIKATQKHPYRGNFTNVDFIRVSADEKVEVTVHLVLTNEPLAVKTGEGLLVQLMHEVQVRALSSSVPTTIHADVSGLVLDGAPLHAREIVLPAGVELITPGDEIVAALNPPKVSADDVAADAAAASLAAEASAASAVEAAAEEAAA